MFVSESFSPRISHILWFLQLTTDNGQLTAFLQSMSQRTWHDDEEDWSETGGDYDAGDDYADDDGQSDDDSIPCPECGIDVYADLDHCPRCGHWLTDADRESRETGLFATRRVRWIAAALLAVFLLGLAAELFFLG